MFATSTVPPGLRMSTDAALYAASQPPGRSRRGPLGRTDAISRSRPNEGLCSEFRHDRTSALATGCGSSSAQARPL